MQAADAMKVAPHEAARPPNRSRPRRVLPRAGPHGIGISLS